MILQNSSFYLLFEENFTFFNGYLLSVICLFGIFTNILNSIVFTHHGLKDLSFKYSKVHSLANAFCLAIGFFMSVYGYSQTNLKVFEQSHLFFLLQYLKEVFSFVSVLIQITICLYRILLVTNHSSIRRLQNYKSISAYLLTFASISFLPFLIPKESGLVFPTGHAAKIATEIIFYLTILKGFVFSAIVIGLSVFTILKVKRHIKKSTKLKANVMVVYSAGPKKSFFFTKSLNQVFNLEIKQKNIKKNNLAQKIVLTITVHCIQFLLTNIPISVVNTYQLYVFTEAAVGVRFRAFYVISNIFFFLGIGSDIFIYYLFNKKYKKCFHEKFMYN